MEDELNAPLGLEPRPKGPAGRLRWLPALASLAVVAGLGAAAWRVNTPRPAEVAIIPAEAVKTVAPSPAPAPAPSAAAAYPTGADGSIAVARSKDTAASGGGPQIIDVAEALGRAAPATVDRRLSEAGRFGLLPRVGPDGARAADVYARPYVETAATRGAPRIALLVGGLGLDARTTEAAIERLPAAVSLGLAPYGAEMSRVAARARGAGHEIWLQAPMEGVGPEEPGPHTLTVEAGTEANRASLNWLMSRFPGYVGVENYLGAKFTADAQALSPALAEIGRRGLLYLDDGSSALSKVAALASGVDLQAGRADVIVDGGAEGVRAALARAEDMARRRGSVVVVASALPGTLERLAPWAQALADKGFALAPVSVLVKSRNARSAQAQ